jgi:phosphoglycolate phosphatase
MHKKIAHIIFDLDGTLIDSAPSILESFKLTLDSHQIEPLVPLDKSLIGPPLAHTLIALTGIEEKDILSKLSDEFKGHYDLGGYRSTQEFVGVSHLLEKCSNAGFYLHIATNKRISPTLLILDLFDWKDYFKSVYATDSRAPAYVNKSAMIADLLKTENIDFDSAIYVGDRFEDLTSAHENNLDFVGALWGYQDPKLTNQEDCCLFNKIEQFESHLALGALDEY